MASGAEYPLLISIWTGRYNLSKGHQNLIQKRKRKGCASLRKLPEYFSVVQPCWKKISFLLNFQSYALFKLRGFLPLKEVKTLPFKWEKYTKMFRTEMLAEVYVWVNKDQNLFIQWISVSQSHLHFTLSSPYGFPSFQKTSQSEK